MKKQTKIDLSISIVSFDTKSLLEQCLYSIFRNTRGINFEVTVVDNGSKDGSLEMVEKQFPQVNLIANPKNFFYSKAHNQAVKKSQGKYILILNSDTIIPPLALQKMIQFMEAHPEAAAASCREVDENGNLDQTCSRFPTPLTEFFESSLFGKILKNQKLLSNFRYGGWKRDTTCQVDVIPGSFIFTRTSVLKKLGFFDENLVLFYSDTDFCTRTKKVGFEVYHNCDVTITHLRAQSIQKLQFWQLYQISEHDILYYYKKHFGLFWWLFLWITLRPNWIFWKIKSRNQN